MIVAGRLASARAQTLPLDPPAFAPLRPDDSVRVTPPGAVAPFLKRIDVGGVGASFGGEVRQRVEHYGDATFGLAPVANDSYDLSRVLAFADLHLTAGLRLFVEVGGHSAIGKRPPLQEPDRDDLDVHQAFLDVPLHGRGRRAIRRNERRAAGDLGRDAEPDVLGKSRAHGGGRRRHRRRRSQHHLRRELGAVQVLGRPARRAWSCLRSHPLGRC